MKTSDDGVEFTKSWETFQPRVYDDGYGYGTVGYGHRVNPGEDYSDGITKDDAEELLLNDLEKAENCVNKNVHTILTQNQFDALVSFVFNCGGANFKKSTMLKRLNDGDMAIGDEFRKWVKSAGKTSRGLVKRREQERKIYEDGEYEFSH